MKAVIDRVRLQEFLELFRQGHDHVILQTAGGERRLYVMILSETELVGEVQPVCYSRTVGKGKAHCGVFSVSMEDLCDVMTYTEESHIAVHTVSEDTLAENRETLGFCVENGTSCETLDMLTCTKLDYSMEISIVDAMEPEKERAGVFSVFLGKGTAAHFPFEECGEDKKKLVRRWADKRREQMAKKKSPMPAPPPEYRADAADSKVKEPETQAPSEMPPPPPPPPPPGDEEKADNSTEKLSQESPQEESAPEKQGASGETGTSDESSEKEKEKEKKEKEKTRKRRTPEEKRADDIQEAKQLLMEEGYTIEMPEEEASDPVDELTYVQARLTSVVDKVKARMGDMENAREEAKAELRNRLSELLGSG